MQNAQKIRKNTSKNTIELVHFHKNKKNARKMLNFQGIMVE